LPCYLLGLALVGLLHALRETRLRVGCELLPAGAPIWQPVGADGSRRDLALDAPAIEQQAREAAAAWSKAAAVVLGTPVQVHSYDSKAGAVRRVRGHAAPGACRGRRPTLD
jgi:hypothetical protein